MFLALKIYLEEFTFCKISSFILYRIKEKRFPMDKLRTILLLEYDYIQNRKITSVDESFIKGYEHAMAIAIPTSHHLNEIEQKLWVVKGILTPSSYFERFSGTQENPLGCILSSTEKNAYHFEDYQQALAVASLFDGIASQLSSALN